MRKQRTKNKRKKQIIIKNNKTQKKLRHIKDKKWKKTDIKDTIKFFLEDRSELE